MDGSLSYEDLKQTYKDFAYPAVEIVINKKPFSKNTFGFIIGEVKIELTSSMEASLASFQILNCYNKAEGSYDAENLSRLVELGAKVTVGVGYLDVIKEVFRGFVCGLEYSCEEGGIPCLFVTALDIKGLMMANVWSKQLNARFYDEAVREILQKPAYAALLEETEIGKTPDRGGEQGEITMEMNAESDYEFIVKAAKKCNFEFFTDCGTVRFRKAKQDTSLLMELGIGEGIEEFHIEYGLMGLVEKIEVRSPDAGGGNLITVQGRRSGKISAGSRAAAVLKKSVKTCIDPTVLSQGTAQARLDYLMEEMSYRFGDLEMEGNGMPDLKPGRFISVKGLGEGISNRFYVTGTVHEITGNGGYRTKLKGRACELKEEKGGLV